MQHPTQQAVGPSTPRTTRPDSGQTRDRNSIDEFSRSQTLGPSPPPGDRGPIEWTRADAPHLRRRLREAHAVSPRGVAQWPMRHGRGPRLAPGLLLEPGDKTGLRLSPHLAPSTPWLNCRTSAQLLDGARLLPQLPDANVNCRLPRRLPRKISVARCQFQLSTAAASCPEKSQLPDVKFNCRLLRRIAHVN